MVCVEERRLAARASSTASPAPARARAHARVFAKGRQYRVLMPAVSAKSRPVRPRFLLACWLENDLSVEPCGMEEMTRARGAARARRAGGRPLGVLSRGALVTLEEVRARSEASRAAGGEGG